MRFANTRAGMTERVRTFSVCHSPAQTVAAREESSSFSELDPGERKLTASFEEDYTEGKQAVEILFHQPACEVQRYADAGIGAIATRELRLA
jgi:hypothetical protein